MDKNISETIIKDVVDVDQDVSVGEQDVKIRKRRTRAEIEQGLTLDQINNIAKGEDDDQYLQDTVNKVVSKMKQQTGISDETISQQQLDEWKLQHGELYRTYLNGQSYIWHKIKRKDYVLLMTDKELSNLESAELRIFLRQEKIMKMCVVYPEGKTLDDIIENNAGVAGNISDEIMMVSGFKPVSSEKL